MDNYIRERLQYDAARLVAQASVVGKAQHLGLRGRFRELLVQELLSPWLPPYARCGSGMIIDCQNRQREHTQEDIVIFDESLVPPILVGSQEHEGVFPFDGVLARIEVKSTLNATELRKAIAAAAEIRDMRFATGIEGRIWPHPITMLFAFDSDLILGGAPDAEYQRLMKLTSELGYSYAGSCSDVPSPISVLCVVGRGAWAWAARQQESPHKWMMADMTLPHNEILFCLGLLSNSCYVLHAQRHGHDPDLAVAGGIGRYFINSESFCELTPNSAPTASP